MTAPGSDPQWVAQRDFLMLPFGLLDAVDGSYPAAALWERIRYRAADDGWWAVTRQDAADELRLSEHGLKQAIATLRDAGLIETERVSRLDATLRYRIVWGGAAAGGGPPDGPPDRDGESRRPETEDSATSETVDSAVSSTQNVRTSPPTPQGADDGGLFAAPVASFSPSSEAPADVMAGFDGWYAQYPRKVGKAAARKAWAAAVRAGATAEQMTAALARQADGLREDHERGVQTAGRSYCPHPSTWLTSGRWDDAPEAVVVTLTERQAVSSYDAYDPAHEAALPPPPRRDLFG